MTTNLMQLWVRYQAGEQGVIEILATQAQAFLRPDRVFDVTRFLTAGDIESLYHEAIWKTLESYDPTRGTKFSTYLKHVVKNEFISEIRKFSFRKRWPVGGIVRLSWDAVPDQSTFLLANETERARFRAVRRIYWKLRAHKENRAAEIFIFRQVFPKVPFKKVNKLFGITKAFYYFWKAKRFRKVVIEEAENICLSE